MEGSIEQHKLFEAGLKKFQQHACAASKGEHDGQKLEDFVDFFGNVPQEHLHDEIPALLSLHYLDSREMMKIWAIAHRAATCNADLYRSGVLRASKLSRRSLRNGPS